MAYTKTNWVNDQQPDIDADNLNKMEQGIYDAQFPDGGTEGQLLAKTVSGQAWVDAPNSAVWGGITGDIADQTDLQAALSSVGKVDSVNGIQPDVSKNVQVDVELTKAEYDALPSSKESDDVNYWIKDGTNIPQASVISASGVAYDNTQSGLTADDVQDAIDENASEIATLNTGLTNVTNRVNSRARVTRFGGSSVTSFKIECINAYQIILVVANTGTRLFMVNPNNGSPVINMFAGTGITVEGLTALSFNLNNCPTYTQFMAISYDDFSVTNN